MPSVGEDVQQLDSYAWLVRMQNRTATLENKLVVFYPILKYTHTIWPAIPFLSTYQKEMTNVPIQELYSNSELLYSPNNCQKLEQTQYSSINEGINYQWYILTMKYDSTIAQMFSRETCKARSQTQKTIYSLQMKFQKSQTKG